MKQACIGCGKPAEEYQDRCLACEIQYQRDRIAERKQQEAEELARIIRDMIPENIFKFMRGEEE